MSTTEILILDKESLLMDERVAEHLSENSIWSVIRKQQPLDQRYRDHIHNCRDCREFLKEVTGDAEVEGFTLDESFHIH